ncbi:MAG: NfeD family protein [Candidatus Tectomicrobia bacterium]|nr:NfeD family protein [Candidatus Tectomicrobia bacterium]
MCHVLLGMPAFGLILFWIVPLPWALAGYGFVNSLAVAMYLLVFQVMRKQSLCGSEAMIGKEVEVIGVCGRNLRVRYANELWEARAATAHAVGDVVRIRALRGLRLLVE